MANMIYDPESGRMVSPYEMAAKKRSQQLSPTEMSAAAKAMPTVPEIQYDRAGGSTDASTDYLAMTAKEEQLQPLEATPGDAFDSKGSAQAAGNQLSKGAGIEDVASSALIASGNPYAMGAGLGLATLSGINKGEQANRDARYKAEVARINARQEAINKLAQISQGLKA
jgi:hypothetical protein